MEKEDLLSDDLLKDLFRKHSWDDPGDDFTSAVMEQIRIAPEAETVKKPFFMMLKSYWPLIILFLFTVLFLLTSDIPFTNYIPGKGFFTRNLIPYFGSLISGLKPFVSGTKSVSIPLMVILAGSLLVGFDYFFLRKPATGHQTTR